VFARVQRNIPASIERHNHPAKLTIWISPRFYRGISSGLKHPCPFGNHLYGYTRQHVWEEVSSRRISPRIAYAAHLGAPILPKRSTRETLQMALGR
jgi:hypothetical protein